MRFRDFLKDRNDLSTLKKKRAALAQKNKLKRDIKTERAGLREEKLESVGLGKDRRKKIGKGLKKFSENNKKRFKDNNKRKGKGGIQLMRFA